MLIQFTLNTKVSQLIFCTADCYAFNSLHYRSTWFTSVPSDLIQLLYSVTCYPSSLTLVDVHCFSLLYANILLVYNRISITSIEVYNKKEYNIFGHVVITNEINGKDNSFLLNKLE